MTIKNTGFHEYEIECVQCGAVDYESGDFHKCLSAWLAGGWQETRVCGTQVDMCPNCIES